MYRRGSVYIEPQHLGSGHYRYARGRRTIAAEPREQRINESIMSARHYARYMAPEVQSITLSVALARYTSVNTLKRSMRVRASSRTLI